MKNTIYLMLIVMIFISCSDNGTEPDPEPEHKIFVSPVEEHVIIDSIAMFELKIENVTNLFAFSGEIHFNSSILESQTEQIIIGNIWDTDPLLQTIFETDCLNICIGLTQTNGSDYINGSGTLFSFSLKGINIGQSDITLNNIQLIDEYGSLIDGFDEIEIGNSIIYVENE